MGLLLLSEFSSIPNLQTKIQSRREQKEKYSPTWTEWAVQNGTQILRDRQGSGVMFTVPNGSVLYITSASLTTSDDSAVSGTSASLDAGSSVGSRQILSIGGSAAQTFVQSITNSFPMPIRVEGGFTVSLTGGESDILGTFQGFEIPRSLEVV